jgi:hypothetical protein
MWGLLSRTGSLERRKRTGLNIDRFLVQLCTVLRIRIRDWEKVSILIRDPG